MAGVIKKKIIRPVRDYTLYALLQVAVLTLKLFPRRFVLFIHGHLAILFYHILSNTRRNVRKHLKLVFGKEKTDEEIEAMSREVFVNLGKTFTDYIIFSGMTTRQQFLKHFTIEGEEHLTQAYNKGKGVLCLIPHTSGWEFSAIMPPILGYETSAISRKIKMKALNRSMIKYRERRGMKNISRDGNVFDRLKEVLTKGECLIIMIDQDSKKIKGEFLKFFEMEAYTPLGCARLAMETGAAIVPMATFRKPDDSYIFKIYPEMHLELTEDCTFDLCHNTQLHNNTLEEIIREYPTQWVWMHQRWDTTPEKLKEYLRKRKINIKCN
ncbi:lysophospholipid acyltransferase family protein [Bacteroides sp. OttesenSCG-928-N06]|nr:lysophospholipid acyltransferase family protein [Bacteroides sp. OttesenSCG-928-N06]